MPVSVFGEIMIFNICVKNFKGNQSLFSNQKITFKFKQSKKRQKESRRTKTTPLFRIFGKESKHERYLQSPQSSHSVHFPSIAQGVAKQVCDSSMTMLPSYGSQISWHEVFILLLSFSAHVRPPLCGAGPSQYRVLSLIPFPHLKYTTMSKQF